MAGCVTIKVKREPSVPLELCYKEDTYVITEQDEDEQSALEQSLDSSTLKNSHHKAVKQARRNSGPSVTCVDQID